MMPKRIQMSRQHPWRAEHPDAVIVARPSRWGNPYRPVYHDGRGWVPTDDNGMEYGGYGPFGSKEAAMQDCVRLFYELEIGCGLLADRGCDPAELRGRDVACWCRLDALCHGDVLLRWANGEG